MKVASDMNEEIRLRISEWQKRLLQLNRRNNLLYFKPSRGTVTITGMTPVELDSKLQSSRSGLRFPFVLPKAKQSAFSFEDEPDVDNEPEVIAGDLSTDCEPKDLQRRLRNLRRKDREWEEEQGLNVLFLAMGFLNWIDGDGAQVRSPLVLVPCDLERSSPSEPYRLCREDDDPVINSTLLHKLSDFGIELPGFSGDVIEDTDSIEEYISEIDRFIHNRQSQSSQSQVHLEEGRSHWSVDQGIALGTFSFSKLAMYEDLTRMREHGIRNELTLMLAGGESRQDDGDAVTSSSGIGSAAPGDVELAGGQLDDVLDIRDQHMVLHADYSQLRAIEEARRGTNLVIHGPPGTGKSQTIANLIATLLADGKRVLFVSEKMAALDVVKRRLEECNLGVFCLDLHSDRGKKAAVYEQLGKALAEPREKNGEELHFEGLVSRRDRLNRLVRLLHRRQLPLNRTVFEVQGQFAQVIDQPRVEMLEIPRATELTTEWFGAALGAAQGIARRPEEFRDHGISRWRLLRTLQPSLRLADQIRVDMQHTLSAVEEFRTEVKQQSDWLGVPEIGSADDASRMFDLLQLLIRSPGIPAAWLSGEVLKKLQEVARGQANQQEQRNRLEEKLSDWFVGQPPSVDFQGMGAAVAMSLSEQTEVEMVVGAGWQTKCGGDPAGLKVNVDHFANALDDLTRATNEMAAVFPHQEFSTMAEIVDSADLTDRILGLDPVPRDWLEEAYFARVQLLLKKARSQVEQVEQAEEQLSESFSDDLVGLVDDEMLVRFRTDYQSSLRRLGAAFRRDQRTIQGQMKKPRKLSLAESLNAVEQAIDLKQKREQWQERDSELREVLGDRFQERETNWDLVEADIAVLEGILNEVHDADSYRDMLSVKAVRRDLSVARRTLAHALDQHERAVNAISQESFVERGRDIASIGVAARRALVPLTRLCEATAPLYPHLLRPPVDVNELMDIIGSVAQLRAIQEEDETLAPGLASDFGVFFRGESTDWEDVHKALEWTAEFLEVAANWTTVRLRNHATDPEDVDAYGGRADRLKSASEGFKSKLDRLNQRFDLDSWGRSSWDEPPLDDLVTWAQDLNEHADGALSWVEYQQAIHKLDAQFGAGSVSELRVLTDRAEDVPDIVSRQILESWLENIYEAEPALGDFNRLDHEEVRSQFRELDEKFVYAARERVRESVFKNYPANYTTPLQSGELGILNGELSKRRRQMPVRRLMSRTPRMLQTLKPCFLMSPLAVSQYLPAGPLEGDHLEFDTVIFDEASQVLPEDALPAIERARQVIVVGDRQQLPPTTFFQGGAGAEEDQYNEDDEDSFEGRESILDVLVGQVGNGVAECYLTVHYRSRCASLIRFSNHAFYEDRLLTFPAPESSVTSIRDEYLPRAIYDAGGRRTNRDEAERVVDIVFELMDSMPFDESIGVVALSRAQADLIEDLVDHRRLSDRQYDERFSEDSPERFFVKNLENIQGDERDHVILSIGYGPVSGGGVPNRFGPINQQGGERRLNVAVTRARKSMTVVHSLKAEDVVSKQPGARLLRRYLEYSRNPDVAIEAEVTGTGEPESPFEESVLAALRNRGHRVEAQVGVSGYRIDLAIRSEDGKRFDLGIECDGATYHSSPAARDRDWLRQKVLEGIGWRIHRVWSTAWARNREGEIQAIEQALEQARSNQWPSPTPPLAPVPDPSEADPDPEVGSTPEELGDPQPLFDEYQSFSIFEADFVFCEDIEGLTELVRDIVEIEQPIHREMVIRRMRPVLGVQQVGRRIRSNIEEAIQRATDGDVCYESSGSDFLCLANGMDSPRPRRTGDRSIDHISDSEIDAGLVLVAQKTFGRAGDELLRETARQFGYDRTGQNIASRLNERMQLLHEDGQL